MMVRAHTASGLPILELYAGFASTNESTQMSTYVLVREVGMEEQVENTTTQLCGDFSCFNNHTIMDFVLSMTSTGDGTSSPECSTPVVVASSKGMFESGA
ncbi:hypothetical protein J1N35_002781 [Gossypium stocksii]|uniref:Uncharacterized protein n=1 Tax=Gossypium stocksii TaxID=47602 RepID=A0A9D4ANZ6_9ROSI|nr:hypothetical protein J1N35_002781 [Gossypium stocksii]